MELWIYDVLIIGGIVIAFGGTMWYLVTHNPNYEPKELLKKPWKIFDLIDSKIINYQSANYYLIKLY